MDETRPQSCRCHQTLTFAPSPHRKRKQPKRQQHPSAMKNIPALAISALLSSTLATSPSSTLLRGAAPVPSAGSVPIVPEGEEGGARRNLLLPDQACYEFGIFGNSAPIPCNATFLNNCDPYPLCADTEQDAVTDCHTSSEFMTVWNNTDPTCPWKYMCC